MTRGRHSRRRGNDDISVKKSQKIPNLTKNVSPKLTKIVTTDKKRQPRALFRRKPRRVRIKKYPYQTDK